MDQEFARFYRIASRTLWREALHMVKNKSVQFEDIDKALPMAPVTLGDYGQLS